MLSQSGMSHDDERDFHRNVIEVSPAPVAIYDAETTIRYVNPAAVEFVNADAPAEVVGRPAREFVHPEDRERIGQRIERVIDEREPTEETEFRFVALDGEEKQAVTAGAPMTYEGDPAGQAVLNDITKRKRRERQLRRERDRFETLFESLPSPATYGVAEEGKPIVGRVNRRFEDVFGYDREEVTGENLDEFIVPEDRRAEVERLNRQILSEGRFRTEVKREAEDDIRDFLLNIVIEESECETEGYAIYTDITERKQAKQELQRQNERLEELVSAMAHDLRNPLHVATASAELLEDAVESDAVDRLVRAHERMDDIIEDILRLAEQGEPITDPEAVGLASVAERAWETSRTAEADLAVAVADSRQLRADPGRFQELFENLFRNAVEHGSTSPRSQAPEDTVEHGSTSSRAQPDDAEHGGPGVTVTVGTLADGFYVEDDGPGIPAGERESVFESGYSTRQEGTGFGLTIVRRIAEAHGWSVRVTEGAAGGARFEFTGVESA